MSNVIIDDTNLVNIADAIREKSGSTDTFLPSEMADAIKAIQGGAQVATGTFTAAATGTAEVVEHGLGKIPSYIIFCSRSTPYKPTYSGTAETVYQIFSSIVRIYDKNGDGELYMDHRCLYSTTKQFTYYAKSSSTAKYTAQITLTNVTPIFALSDTNANTITGARISRVNENTFTTPSYLYVGKEYIWFAIA